MTSSAVGPPPNMQHEWFRRERPRVPGLLDHLRTDGTDYDLVFFWSYRYYPSFFGLPLVRDRAILVPTAEEDPTSGSTCSATSSRCPPASSS